MASDGHGLKPVGQLERGDRVCGGRGACLFDAIGAAIVATTTTGVVVVVVVAGVRGRRIDRGVVHGGHGGGAKLDLALGVVRKGGAAVARKVVDNLAWS
jgi:hypothetical protein